MPHNLPRVLSNFLVAGFDTNKPDHSKPLIEDKEGDLEVPLSCWVELFGIVGEPSLLAAAITYSH